MRPRLFRGLDLAVVIPPAVLMSLTAYATKSFWGDEILSLHLAARPWPAFLAGLSADYHPPLYFLLLKAWLALFGDGELGLRLFQAWQCAAGLACALMLLRTVFPRRRYPLMFLLLLLSVELWLFGPMLRYYALAAALAAAATLLLLRWLASPRSGLALGLAGAYVLLLYTDYPTAFVLAIHAAYVAWKQSSLLRKYLVILLGGVAAFLPWLVVLAGQLDVLIHSEQVADLNATLAAIPLKVVFGLYAFLVGETVYPIEPLGLAGMAGFAAVAVALLRRGRLRSLRAEEALFPATVLLGLAATATITTLISRHTSFVYTAARTLYVLVFVFVSLGVAYERLGRGPMRRLLVGTMAALAVYGLVNLAMNRHLFMPVYAVPWREIVEEVRGQAGIMLSDEGRCYAYYARQRGAAQPHQINPVSLPALTGALAAASAPSGGATVFLVLTERESSAPGIPAEVVAYLQRHGELLTHRT